MHKFFNKLLELTFFLLAYPLQFFRWFLNRIFAKIFYHDPSHLPGFCQFRDSLPPTLRQYFDDQWKRDRPRFSIVFGLKKIRKIHETDVLYIGTFKADAQKDIIALRKFAPKLRYTAVFMRGFITPAHFFVFRYFDEVVFLNTYAQLVIFLLSCKAKVLIFQGGDDNPAILNCLARPGRFVWQVRDTYLRIPREHITQLNFERARFIAKRADAIVTFHKREGWERLAPAINVHGKVFSIPPLCVPTIGPRVRKEKLSSRDGEIHIVYAGGVGPPEGSRAGSLNFTHAAFFEKFKIIANQKIHIHVYSTHLDSFSRAYEDYFLLEKANRYFHIEKSVPFEKLLVEFTQYDWAIMHVTWQKELLNPGFDAPIQNGLMGPIQSKIPIIVSPTALGNAELVEKYQRGIVVDENDLPYLKKILIKNAYLCSHCEKIDLPPDLLYNIEAFGRAVFKQ